MNVMVIPTLNEEKNIADVIKRSKEILSKNDKIIVIDGLSTDNTVKLVRENFPDVTVLMERRAGKGIAIRTGFHNALSYRPDYITMIDADGEKDPADIPKLIENLERTGADMVIGLRERMRSRNRSFLNIYSNWWLRFATGYKIMDGLSGFNVIRAGSLRKMGLKSNNFEIETELILEARKNNMKVVQYPVKTPEIAVPN